MLKYHILSVLFGGALFALASCGGSSGSSSAGDKPDEETPGSESLVISGSVTDMPIPNADVVCTVNGQRFESAVATDVNGSFDIEVETTNPNALVVCEGIDPVGVVRFTAVFDDFAGLAETGGDDGTVENQNITNITTALYLLAEQLADDGSIDSAAELKELAEQVNAEDLLDVAAAIKVVVEGIDSVTLPEDYDDVQALAEAIVNGDSTFVEDIGLTLDNARDLLLTDGNATVPFDADEATGVLVDVNNFFAYALYGDNTGLAMFAASGVEELPAWSVTDAGALQLDYPAALQRRETLVALSDADGVMGVAITRENLGDSSTTVTAETLAYSNFEGGFTAEGIVGSYWPASDPNDVTVFMNGGTGFVINPSTGVVGETFGWQITADGDVVMTYSNSSTDTLSRLAGSTDDAVNTLLVARDPASAVTDMEITTYTRSDELIVGQDNDNTALLAGKIYAYIGQSETALYVFGADGTFSKIAQVFVENADDVPSEAAGSWLIDANGTLTMVTNLGTEIGAITSGTGTDEMEFQRANEAAIALVRILPFDAASLPLTEQLFWLLEDNQQVAKYAAFLEDGTGYFSANDPFDNDDQRSFTWTVNTNGQLVLTMADDSGEQQTYYRVAAPSDLEAIQVTRVDGELDFFASDAALESHDAVGFVEFSTVDLGGAN